MTDIQCTIRPFGVANRTGDERAIELSPGLETFSIIDSSGAEIGKLFGTLLRSYIGSGLSIDGLTIHADFEVGNPETFETRVLDGLHGVFLLRTGGRLPRRLYPDCGASIPLVYCTKSRRYGSSAAMFLDEMEYTARFNDTLHRRVVTGGVGGSWITGTLTAHHDILRLLPNFYLDLESWETVRFWPRVNDVRLERTEAAVVSTVSEALRGFVGAVARERRVGITATAGFDSRILMASARDVADQVEFFTIGDKTNGVDQVVPARLAHELRLRHRVVPAVHATIAQKREWDRLVGDVVRESTRDVFPTLSTLDYDVILTGMYGETGRARLYRQDTKAINDLPATPEFVLARLTLPLTTEVVANIAEWLEPIRGLPRSAVLDLAFNELRFGSWAMAQAPVQKAMMLTMMPFAQRSIQAAFMDMDPSAQGTAQLFGALGRSMWPEAMEHPINKFGDYRDWTAKFTKGNLWHRLIRFSRDRFAAMR